MRERKLKPDQEYYWLVCEFYDPVNNEIKWRANYGYFLSLRKLEAFRRVIESCNREYVCVFQITPYSDASHPLPEYVKPDQVHFTY